LLLLAPILLLAVSVFSSCMHLPMRNLWPDRQCCQGAEISATKLLEFLAKLSTRITIIWFTLFSPTILLDLAENVWFGNTGKGALLPCKALHNVIKILNFKYEDVFKI
jgi:hypothetical protein